MIKVIVTEDFTLGRFNELKNIERANSNKNEDGHLYVNDKFECNEEMARYLSGENGEHRAFVKTIEIILEDEKSFKIEMKHQKIEEKPKRRRRSVAKD